jgi:hypothetical protein
VRKGDKGERERERERTYRALVEDQKEKGEGGREEKAGE